MAARSGMATLITRLREMVDDSASSVWTDDELQTILDQNRVDFFAEPLTAIARNLTGVTTYTVYSAPYQNLEEYTAADLTVFRLFNSVGTSIAPSGNYTPNYSGGVFTFSSDQRGAAYYLDGRSFDLSGAAAMCWREAMGSKAKLYTFSEDQQSFSRSHWFQHCKEMAEMYSRLKRRMPVMVVRG